MILPPPDRLLEAWEFSRRHTLQTPLLEVPGLAREIGARRLFVKAESLQRSGSFKIRGALWKLRCLSPEQRSRGVIAFSSGNFAQGLAAAGRRLGVAVTLVMPEDAPENKRRATEELGAEVVLSVHGRRPREEVAAARAQELARERSLSLLHPFDDPDIVAGQAAVGLEALQQLEDRGESVDRVVVPVGGGGLVAGLALAFRERSPATEVIAAEPVGFDAMGRSLRAGEVIRAAAEHGTLCDALQATRPGAAPFAAAQQCAVRGVAVDDDAVRAAVRRALSTTRLVLEPSGAIGLAAILSGALPTDGARILVIASGGNVDLPGLRRATHASS